MKAQKWFSMILAIVVVFSLLLPVAVAEEETIKIGGMAPLTGPYAQYGEAVKNGANLYVNQLNANGGIDGKMVEILWEDHAANDAQAQNIYYQYVDEDEVVAILGDVLSGQCRIIAGCAYEDGVPMVTASGTAFDINVGKPNVFRTCFFDEFQGAVMANFCAQQGYEKVAILYGADSAYSMGLYNAFKEQAAINSINIVADEAAAFTDIDFKAQLTNIKNAEPDAVFLPWYGAEAALILTQAAELGLDVVYMGADGIADIVDKISDKSLLTKMTYTDHFAFDSDEASVQTFITGYETTYGVTPDISFSATGYDAALVICQAIDAADIEDYSDSEAVYAAIIEQIKAVSVTGVSGVISFDENNNPIKSAFVMTFDEEGVKHFVTRVDPQ